MNVADLHNAVKKAVEELREETGAFTHLISIEWEGDKLSKVSTQMGSASKYTEKEDEEGE